MFSDPKYSSRNHAGLRRWLVLATGLLGWGSALRASDAIPYVLPNSELRALPQTSTNGHDYVLYVGFPFSYATSPPTRRYPVIYLCDGAVDFPLVAYTADFLRRDGHVPEAIVVGIGYAGTNSDPSSRDTDLIPGPDNVSPGAKKFLGVIANEIIPFVGSSYKVDTSYRILLGNSLGGLFVMYAAFERPGLFQGYVASGSSLELNGEYVLSRARSHAATGAPLNARLYVGWASGDDAPTTNSSRHFAQEVAKLNIPGLKIAARQIEGGGHSGSKPENFTRGMRFAFAPKAWMPTIGMDPGYGQLGKMINLSTRGRVAAGENVMIAGVVVDGILPKRVLIRAAGPSLGPLGVTEPLANPRFRVVNRDGTTVAENDDWGSATDPAALTAATTAASAFPFASGSHDAAIIALLDPGLYTVVVESADGTSGVALVEAYELGP
jgi:predicted alpha/beta superfamily hydrolase